MTKRIRTRPAQIVFTEKPVRYGAPTPAWAKDHLGKDVGIKDRWIGQLLAPRNVIDMSGPGRHAPDEQVFNIVAEIVESTDGQVNAWVRGGPKGSTRYYFAWPGGTDDGEDPVIRIQEQIIAWAGRRFRTPLVEVEERPGQRLTWYDMPIEELSRAERWPRSRR